MSFLSIFKRELGRIFKDVAIVLTIIGGVILYAFLYPQPYSKQSISALPISVVDLDKTSLSRSIVFKLNATPQIRVIRHDTSQKDAKDALVRNEIKAIVIIPKDFTKEMTLGMSPTVALGADSSYFLIYGGILEGAMKSILTQSAMIKVGSLLKDSLPLSGAEEAYTPYTLNIMNLFNPQNSYTQYVIPAVFILILQQTMLIGLGILGGGVNEAREKGEHSEGSTIMVMFSRLVIFGTIFFIHMLFYFGFSFEFFGVIHLASIIDLLNFGVAFIIASLFLGIFLGALFNSREVATPAILFSSLPLVFSAGFVWPLEEIPQWVQLLANCIPSTPAINGFLKLNQMGADFGMVIAQYELLWIQAGVYATLGYLTLRMRTTT
jgi:ABC-2 type transport system permease protein